MKFFIDTANLDQIREAQSLGVLDGVTTNPSLMAKEGITGEKNIIQHYIDICEIVDGDVSAEVISVDFKGMVEEGKILAALDVSVDGSGFFQVLMPDGRIGYTRNGAFGRNAEGSLTTASGYVVQPEIAIPEGVTNINISADGIVSVQNPGEVEAEEVGQFQLADFPNSRGLQPIGQSMLVETPASGAAVVANPYANGFGSLVQGALESSNVNVVQELVDMIETQRAYEVNSKAISGVDDMLRFISQNL